jgi:hypothetical protein
MATTYEDIDINQGADIAIEIECTDQSGAVKDLTNHSINAKMKRTYNSTDTSDIQAFNAVVQSPADAGKLTLSLTNAQTSTLRRGRYVYDAELSFVDSDDNTIIERILEGQVNVLPQVT